MKDKMSKFRSPKHVVADPCAGSPVTARAWMVLHRHSRSIGCEIKMDYHNHIYISVVETFSRQVPTRDQDITGSEGVVEAAKSFAEMMYGIATKTRRMIKRAPPGCSPKHSFLSHITHFMANCSKDSSPLEMGHGVPVPRWAAKWCAKFHAIKSNMLQVVDCTGYRGTEKKF